MKLNIYAVYDTKSCAFGIPFFQINDNVAKRAFYDLVNNPDTTVSRHPSDYILHQVGEYEDSTGLLTAITPVLSLGNASEYKRDKAPLELAKALASVVQADVKNGTEEVLR